MKIKTTVACLMIGSSLLLAACQKSSNQPQTPAPATPPAQNSSKPEAPAAPAAPMSGEQSGSEQKSQ
jgi:hypothetical protein